MKLMTNLILSLILISGSSACARKEDQFSLNTTNTLPSISDSQSEDLAITVLKEGYLRIENSSATLYSFETAYFEIKKENVWHKDADIDFKYLANYSNFSDSQASNDKDTDYQFPHSQPNSDNVYTYTPHNLTLGNKDVRIILVFNQHMPASVLKQRFSVTL